MLTSRKRPARTRVAALVADGIPATTVCNLKQGEKIMAVVCPECDNPLDIDTNDVEEGEIIQCDECGTDLEVVSSDPLELSAVDEEGYDDEDDETFARADDDDEEDE
jgi:alpha-aminoadipate carrier protein LysW